MKVFLGLGSNLGDRAANLEAALDALAGVQGVTLGRVSTQYASEPWGVATQPEFLNCAAEIETVLEPLELLNAVKQIEAMVGREPGPRWGPRAVDIDIVLWGREVMETSELTVPHKSFRERRFVLMPLAEIAPDARDPITGMTVAELLAQPEVQGWVRARTV